MTETEASSYQYRVVCPVTGSAIDHHEVHDRADAEEWATAYSYEHRHHSCRGQGHTIERRFIGPWSPIEEATRDIRIERS